MSQPFLLVLIWVFFSFAQYVGVAQLVLGYLSEVITLFVAVNSSCPREKWHSQAFYVGILVDSFLHFFF